MNIIGKWKLKAINVPTENGMTLYTRDTLPEEYTENFEEAAMFYLEFTEDHVMNILAEETEELLQLAAEQGIEKRDDGFITSMSATWKEVDGKIFYDSMAEGEVLGEEVDPFVELEMTDDGCILYNFGMCLYERI